MDPDPRFPPLSDPYDTALRQAVALILSRFDVLGIIASGTIIRGNPGPSSDLDIYVIHAQPQRQRIQKRFNGVPAEIFINPLKSIDRYFVEERQEGRPITAHMLATGFVVLDRDPIVEDLRSRARALLEATPDPSLAQLRLNRYLIASLVEDAFDVAAADPVTAILILSGAVHDMLHYCFWVSNRNLPRDKDLLRVLSSMDADLAALAQEFYSTADPARRLVLAGHIADRTIGVRGFFEWESDLEDISV